MEREFLLTLSVNGGSFTVILDDNQTSDWVEFSGEFDRDLNPLKEWIFNEVESWLRLMQDEQGGE